MCHSQCGPERASCLDSEKRGGDGSGSGGFSVLSGAALVPPVRQALSQPGCSEVAVVPLPPTPEVWVLLQTSGTKVPRWASIWFVRDALMGHRRGGKGRGKLAMWDVLPQQDL